MATSSPQQHPSEQGPEPLPFISGERENGGKEKIFWSLSEYASTRDQRSSPRVNTYPFWCLPQKEFFWAAFHLWPLFPTPCRKTLCVVLGTHGRKKIHRAGKMAQLAKHLLLKLWVLSFYLQQPTKACSGMHLSIKSQPKHVVAHACDPSAGDVETRRFWGSMSGQRAPCGSALTAPGSLVKH